MDLDINKTIYRFNTTQAGSQKGHAFSFAFSLFIVAVNFDTVYLENMYGLLHCCQSCLKVCSVFRMTSCLNNVTTENSD